MKIKSFEFNLRELDGSMGDFGTLFPLAVGYIVTCGLDPAGFLVMMGIVNIVTGLIYKLPMPLEPMKVLAVIAITQHWTPSMIYASGFAMGIVWVLFALTGVMDFIAKITPQSVIRGVQLSLGFLLAFQAIQMIKGGWILGIVSIAIVLVFRQNKYAPAAILLMFLGIGIMFVKGQLNQFDLPLFKLPALTTFAPQEVWQSLVKAGFAQIPLTATNAVIATAILIKKYWPDRSVSEKKLALNMGIMNLVAPFFGGMPMCHGAGGLAGQYYYGARTGGTNILEGIIEVSLGLFFASSIAAVFGAFPSAIIGAMMFLVGIELTKFARNVKLNQELIPLGITVSISILTNMAYGFVAGMAAHYMIDFFILKWTAKHA